MRNEILRKKGQQIPILRNIQLVVYDFDGVMTDNKVILREDGVESVIVNRSDGLAIGMIKEMKIPQIILSTEANKVVETRANKLDIPVIKDVKDKKEILLNYCKKHDIPLNNVVYIGNDINDIEAMKVVGHPVCPSDACDEVKMIPEIILDVQGGDGVVRDFLKYIETNNKEEP